MLSLSVEIHTTYNPIRKHQRTYWDVIHNGGSKDADAQAIHFSTANTSESDLLLLVVDVVANPDTPDEKIGPHPLARWLGKTLVVVLVGQGLRPKPHIGDVRQSAS